ncbi:acetyl-CoA carboxylase carboxyl transferase subunit [Nocardiopsis halophila]|uniref:acetyl-CoA carboxylase carboxyl transferase subunit n=1 Tax=Nocardiopsis halophila TaxID=141692 RepID=UPI0005854D89|nr:acetyl-CoA carboxylase carboxyl transferase subunit [Nocardiopsis halophila]
MGLSGETLEKEWTWCRRCTALIYTKRFHRSACVCPDCGWHGPLSARQRVHQLFDEDGWTVLEGVHTTYDPLGFVDSHPYPHRLAAARDRTGMDEAVMCVRGTIEGRGAVAAVMDFRFMGGSLGSAVGEAIVRAADTALEDRVPLVLVSASGGARMQEGVVALMQMAKTVEALTRLDEAGILTVSLVSDPTYGGVAASFATACDVILSEPGARLGFAGPRVIAQTIREDLPEGFQTAETLFENGLIDEVVPRTLLRSILGRLLAVQQTPTEDPPETPDPLLRDPALLPERDPWQAVQQARDLRRPTALEYISLILEDFVELHGDRVRADCPALVGGVGLLCGRPVVVIGTEKGHTPQAMAGRNFGMASPPGYRKAGRLMRLADKLGLPVVTLIDTPGAHPGVQAEQQGQALRIAESLRQMAELRVPSVAVVIGEGGSGGALALGFADRTVMCANATYSVISPEGCAAILWNDRDEAPTAAAKLGLDSRSLMRLGVVDGVLSEPGEGAHEDPAAMAGALRGALIHTLRDLLALPEEELRSRRHDRIRAFGAPDARLAEEVIG